MQHPGWCEHDPNEISSNVIECIKVVMNRNKDKKLVSIGITNQRETTIALNKRTKKPLYNAIVWHDTRTEHIVNELKTTKFNNNVNN